MDDKLTEASLYTIKGVAILDNDGERIFSKYYDETFPTVKEQKEFEKNLFQKTSKQNAEIIMLEGLTVVYRSNIDLYFYIMGSQVCQLYRIFAALYLGLCDFILCGFMSESTLS